MESSRPNLVRDAIGAELDRVGVSQRTLSRRSGISQGKVNQYVGGRVDVTTANASKMLAALSLAIVPQERLGPTQTASEPSEAADGSVCVRDERS